VTTIFSGLERIDIQAPVFDGCFSSDEVLLSNEANTFSLAVPYEHKFTVKASHAKYPAEYFGKIQNDILTRLKPSLNFLTANPEIDDF